MKGIVYKSAISIMGMNIRNVFVSKVKQGKKSVNMVGMFFFQVWVK